MTAKNNFDSDQLERLKVWFDINPSPSRHQVDHISAQMKVASASVWMWFHRQRNRVKANQDISPQKVKTASRKGSSSPIPHMNKVRTRSLSAGLDCNRNTHANRDIHEQAKEREETRQDRVRAKKGHIRGILRTPETRQQSGERSAEEKVRQKVKEVERKQQVRVKFSEYSKVDTVNEPDMQKLEQECIGLKTTQGSINRTKKEAGPREHIGVDTAQGCFKRKEKVTDSLKQNRGRSLSGHMKRKEKISDPWESNAAKLPQGCTKKVAKEGDSHQNIGGTSVQGSRNRVVKGKNTQQPVRMKPISGSLEADSQKLIGFKPVQRCLKKIDKVADSQECNRGKSAQGSIIRAEKVSEKQQRPLSQSDKECHLKQNKLTHRVRSMSIPKRIDSSGNVPANHGVHERLNVSEGKPQIGVNSAPVNRPTEEREGHCKLKKEKDPVAKRRFKEILGSSEVNVHHRPAENNLRHLGHRSQLADMSSSSVHIKKCKHKSRKAKRVQMPLTHKSPNPSANEVKSHTVLEETEESPEMPQAQSKMKTKICTSRRGIFSALSLPQEKVCANLSDSSDAEDFQDDQNTRTHKLSMKNKNMADTLGNGKSIPVLSRKRQQSTLTDCSNRVVGGSNLRRIPLKSLSQVCNNDLPVSPVKCDVSSTSVSQSSVISSTVAEVSDPSNLSLKQCQRSSDSLERDSCEIAIRITERSLQGKKIEEKESVNEVGKSAGLVISDKFWNRNDSKFLFKKELSVNLKRINISSVSDKREVPVSSKMNLTSRHEGKKDSNPLCENDRTDINANVSANLSSVPKIKGRSIWSSIASSVETSSMVWNSIASSNGKPQQEIPFIESSRTLNRESNKLWSAIASSDEISHKKIPFIESSDSVNGESTPSSSQDSLESKDGLKRSESIFDEDSCEVSSSVDLEKMPAGLSENMEEIEETSSAVVERKKEEVKETSADAKENTVPSELTETVKEMEKTSADVVKRMEGHDKSATDLMGDIGKTEKSSADLVVRKEEVEETPAELMEHQGEAERTPADLAGNLKGGYKTTAPSTETMIEAKKVTENKSSGEKERTEADLMETLREVNKAPAESVEKTESSREKDKEESDEKPDNKLQDLYEDIDSPDYDIGSPYMVLDEVSCSDIEESEPNVTASQDEFSLESAFSASKSQSPSSPKVKKNAETCEVIDNCSDDDDEVIVVSSSAAKQTRKDSPGNQPLKNQPLCNSKPVGQGKLAVANKTSSHSPTHPTSSKSTEKKDFHEVIDLEYCSEDDEVILVSTQVPSAPSSKHTAKLSNEESKTGSPTCPQISAQAKSVSQELPIAKENVTTQQYTPSVRDDLSESQGVSGNTEIGTREPVDDNLPSDGTDAGAQSINSCSVQNDRKISECPKSEESHEDSAEAALSSEKKVDADKEHFHETTDLCLIKNVVSLCSPLMSATCVVPPQLVQGKEEKLDISSSEKVAAIPVKKISDENVYKEEGNECKEEKIKLLRSLGEIASGLDERSDHKASRTQNDQQDSCGSALAGPIAIEDLKTEEMDALAQNVGHGDHQSSDDIILDMSCENVSTVSYAQDNLKSSEKELDTSKHSVGRTDSSSGDELVIDMEACDQMECSLPEKDVSENTSASLSNAAVGNLDLSGGSVRHDNSTPSDQIDLNLTCDACTRPNAEKDLKSSEEVEESESDAGHKASGSSDEHFIDVNECDAMESALLEKEALEKDTSEKDNCLSSNDDGVVLENLTSEEIFLDVTTFEETKSSLPDRNVSETDTSVSPNDTLEGRLDPVKQTVVCEDSTFDDKLYIDVNTCDDTDSSLQADAVSENDANASTCNALGEEMDPSKKNVPCEDSASDDELYTDVTTCDDVDCPKDIASSENSINTSLDSSLKSKKLALATDANSSGSVADVLNQGSLDKESAGNNSKVLRELELPLHVKDSSLSSGDTLPCETKVHLDAKRSPSANAGTTSMELSKGLDAEDAMGEARSSADACTSDCGMDVATPPRSKLNENASLMGTSNKSPSPTGTPTIDSPRISSEASETLSDQKEEPAAGQHADAHGSSSPSKAVNIPVENTPIPSLVNNDVTFTSSSLNISTSAVTAEDPQLKPGALSDAANHRLPETGIKIKSELDVAAEKDTQAETNTCGDTTKNSNSAEKLKRPRSLHKLVSDLAQRLGISVEAATPSPSSIDLSRSTVGINRNACYSAKSSSSSSTEPAPQPSKPTQEPRRGSKRRVISNKNFKRPPIPEAVQLRIQQLNPYPYDHSWMRNVAVVELAQKEAQLDCQPGETSSTTDHNMGASIESSYLLDATDTAAGTLNFCYQPGMGPINRDSRCATDRVSTSATAASSSVSSRNQRAEAQPSGSSTNSGQCSTRKNNALLIDLLKSTLPLERKRSRTQSGDSKKRMKSRKRRKSSDDVRWEIASRANAFASGSFSEKDIREEWMELLKVMEESTLSGTEEQPPSSGTITLASSATAAASEGNPNSPTVVPAEGHPPTVLRVSEMSSTTSSASASAYAEDKLPAAPDDQAAALKVSETSLTTASALEVDDLSNMPSILRVFSLREEEGGQESSPVLKPSSLGSYDPNSARIVEEHRTPAQIYSSAAAAAAASAAKLSFQGTTNPASSLPSYQTAQALNRKRHSLQTFGSMDGAPPLKAAATATAVNGPTFQEIPAPVLQQNQTNMNTSFPQQVSSVRVSDSGSLSGALPTYNAFNSTSGNRPSGISPNNSYVINTPIVSPPSSNAQGATGILASPPVLVAPQPIVTLVPIQPRAQQQVQPSQPSLLENGTTLVGSHLNPLILNQEIQRLRFSASPPLCTPYPTSSASDNVNLNSLSGQPAPVGNAVGHRIAYLAGNALGSQLATGVSTQWTQPMTNLQLAPVTSQTYSNGLNSQSSTLIYNPQGSTITFLQGPPR